MTAPASVDAMQAVLREGGYVADRGIATVAFLAVRLGRPLFLEGEPGTGKTAIAGALAAGLGRRLIRLQCYEGLDIASAAYEWDYPRQMLHVRLAQAAGAADVRALEQELYSERFLIKRPLLQALDPGPGGGAVLLIDEIDRADAPFEAYLLELLSEQRMTIPELGPVVAAEPPLVVLTSNRTREVHDAVKRRCLYHWLDFPDASRELDIVAMKVPDAGRALAAEVVAFLQALRRQDLFKAPGVAETLDWLQALLALGASSLEPDVVHATIGAVVKYQEDLDRLPPETVATLLKTSRARAGSS